MDRAEASFSFTTHESIVLIVMAVVDLFVMTHPPHGWNTLCVALFVVVAPAAFFLGILKNAIFSGYGVRDKINQMVQAQVVPNFELTWRGIAVRPLTPFWALFLALNAMIIATVEIPAFIFTKGYVLDTFAAPFVAGASALLIALAGEIYVWILVDRRRHWYLDEWKLREFLARQRHSQGAIDTIVRRAREAGLLVTKAPQK